MRAFALIALLGAASCSDDSTQNKAAALVAVPPPGQWELASQVTRFDKADNGTPRINTPIGTRAAQSLCVAPGAQLPTALFAGDDFTCSYGNYYVRNGTANVTLTCQREGLAGNILMTVDGTFGADRISLHRTVRTILTTDGDVQYAADVTGHRTGACTPAAPGPVGNNH
jgi:hypothetical protein